jgi:hypothetical protein
MADLEEILGGSVVAPVENNETPVQEQPTESAEQNAETHDAEQPEGARVPVAALQKEREKAKRYTEEVVDLRRQIAEQDRNWQQRFEQLVTQLQPKQPEAQAPDFWEAPETAIDHRLTQAITPLQQALMAQREGMSRMMAVEKHGEEAVNEAYQALAAMKAAGGPEFQATFQQVMSSPHPYGALVAWHGKQKVMSEIGSDPAAYREKLKAELLAEMQANGGQPQAQQPAPVMPSNFATARNVGTRAGPAWGGPTPIADIFKR